MKLSGSRAAVPLQAYVLHSYDWSESSLIVELFTRSQGRVVVAAKGAKRPTSQMRSVLLPFQPIAVLLGKTPADESNEILNLRSAEWLGGQPLPGAAALLPGFHVNELVLKLLARQDPHPLIFDLYADTLAALAAPTSGGTEAASLRGTEAASLRGAEAASLRGTEAASLRAFEIGLLHGLGWLPDLSVQTQTAQALRAEGRYQLNAEAGLQASAADGITGAAWTALAAALVHGAPAALRAACAPVAASLRVPLRGLLQYHLGHAPLRTRQVWQGVQQLAALPPVRVAAPASAT